MFVSALCFRIDSQIRAFGLLNVVPKLLDGLILEGIEKETQMNFHLLGKKFFKVYESWVVLFLTHKNK